MSQTSTAYETLRRAILDGEIAPDSPLAVSGLKKRFGFGWTPLREALSRLEAERLAHFEPNRGYRTAPVSVAALKDLQIARKTVEMTLFLRSIERGGDEWEAGLVAAHHLLAQAPKPAPGAISSAGRLWEKRHNAFHGALLSAADAPWLEHLAHQTSDQLHRHHRYILYGPEIDERLKGDKGDEIRAVIERTLGIAHHTDLMDAAIARDREAAGRLFEEHIGFSLAVYETLLPDEAGRSA